MYADHKMRNICFSSNSQCMQFAKCFKSVKLSPHNSNSILIRISDPICGPPVCASSSLIIDTHETFFALKNIGACFEACCMLFCCQN